LSRWRGLELALACRYPRRCRRARHAPTAC
jgi:hypothetical protein